MAKYSGIEPLLLARQASVITSIRIFHNRRYWSRTNRTFTSRQFKQIAFLPLDEPSIAESQGIELCRDTLHASRLLSRQITTIGLLSISAYSDLNWNTMFGKHRCYHYTIHANIPLRIWTLTSKLWRRQCYQLHQRYIFYFPIILLLPIKEFAPDE